MFDSDDGDSVSSSSTMRSDVMSFAGTEEVEKDSLLHQALDALYEKRGSTREKALESIIEAFSSNLQYEFLENRFATLLNLCTNSIKRGSAKETSLASRVVGLLALTSVSGEAGHYAQAMIPSLFAYGLLQCLIRFLQAQNIVFPMMLTIGIATLLHLPLCWALVFKTELKDRGAAVATTVSYWVNVILLFLYIGFSPLCKRTWTGFSKDAPRNIPAFIWLAVPSACMICLEMWSFEMIVLLAGFLPNPKPGTSVLSICLNTASTVRMIPSGLGGAVSTRVSNELGAGRAEAARLAVVVVMLMTFTEGIVVGSILILIRNVWGYAYSNDQKW